MDDLYNNLKVYESEIKRKLSSSSNSQNVAFVSLDNSSSTNEIVNTAHSVSTTSSKDQASTASYADDIDADDLEEMDLKWQVVMLTMRVKRAPRNQGNKNRDAPRRNAPVDTSTNNALVVQDGIDHVFTVSLHHDGIFIAGPSKKKKKKSLDYNNLFLGKYECSSLALDREERRDEKEEIGSLETRSTNVSDQEI
ncbi:hypothetical protein Tco_0784367 [Tanacetum coccineum]